MTAVLATALEPRAAVDTAALARPHMTAVSR